MNTFWIKIVVLAVVFLAIVIVVKRFSTSEDERFVRPEGTKQSRQADEDLPRTEAVLEKAVPEAVEEQSSDEQAEELNPRAEDLYQMALVESKIAKKPFMTYKRMVDYCRQIIQQYPDSSYAPKARELLRQMPQRYREQYNVTDEEIGL